jgi:uncharacterized protein DUF4252
MKPLMPCSIGIALLSGALSVGLGAETVPPGQVDFGKFSPPSGGEFVEVNLSSSLINLAAKFLEKQEPDVARLLSNLQLVHVNVIGLDDANRSDLEKRAQRIRKELDSKGWERIVTAQQRDQEVGVYLKTQGKETVQGVVVMIMEGKRQAVFVNIVGDIKPEQLAMLGEKLHIDPLKKAGKAIEKPEKDDSQQ